MFGRKTLEFMLICIGDEMRDSLLNIIRARCSLLQIAAFSQLLLFPMYFFLYIGQKKRRKSRVWGYLLFASTKIIYFRLKLAKKRSIAVQYRLKRSISLGKTKYNLPIPFQINNQTKKMIMAVATMAAQPFIMRPSIFLSHSVA